MSEPTSTVNIERPAGVNKPVSRWLCALLVVLALLTGGVVGATAFSGSGDTPAASESRASSAAHPPTSSGPALSPRGARPKRLGEVAAICADRDCQQGDVATFTVDKIEVDAPCADPFTDVKPKHGHLIAVSVTVTTTDKFTAQHDGSFTNITQHEFSIIGPDGVVENSVTFEYKCLPSSDMLPYGDPLMPSSTYHGKVLLDSRNTTGVLVLRIIGVKHGWEWTFPG